MNVLFNGKRLDRNLLFELDKLYRAGRNPIDKSRRMKKAETLLTKLYERKLLPFWACKRIMRIVNRYFIEPEFKALRGRVAQDLTKPVYNPMYSLPVNGGCVCGSGKKLKKCCLPVYPRVVTGEQWAVINAMIDKGKRFTPRPTLVIAEDLKGVSRETNEKQKRKIEIVKK